MFGNRELWEARSLLAVRSGVVSRLSETFPSRRVCLGSTSLVGEAQRRQEQDIDIQACTKPSLKCSNPSGLSLNLKFAPDKVAFASAICG